MKLMNNLLFHIKSVIFLSCILIITSCTFPDEYVCITVVNKTSETVNIYSGFAFPDKVDAKSESVISVGKGYEISAEGEDTKSDYGSMVFYNDGERWIIH